MGENFVGRARQNTDDNITRCVRFECWITKATNTHSEYVILFAFHSNSCCANALQCYVYTYIACLAFITFIINIITNNNNNNTIQDVSRL